MSRSNLAIESPCSKRVEAAAPDLADKVRADKMTLDRAERVIRDRQAERAPGSSRCVPPPGCSPRASPPEGVGSTLRANGLLTDLLARARMGRDGRSIGGPRKGRSEAVSAYCVG